jgi:hypothetical protein
VGTVEQNDQRRQSEHTPPSEDDAGKFCLWVAIPNAKLSFKIPVD